MVLGNIGRSPTEQERRDYRGVGDKTVRQIFLDKLNEIEKEFTRAHKPFDSQCAKFDFTDEIENVEKESERIYGSVRPEDIDKVDLGDLRRYGDENRFKQIGDSEEVEMQNINGVRSSVKTGHSVKYVCERGHGFTVFMPMDIYEERFGKKKVETKDKQEDK